MIILDNVFSIAFLAISLLFLIFITIFYCCNYTKKIETEDEKFAKKYGTFYEELRIDVGVNVLSAELYKNYRDLILILSIVFLNEYLLL